jgi:hypothetical protein
MAQLDAKAAAAKLHTIADLLHTISTDPSLARARRLKWGAAIRGLVRGARTQAAQLPADGIKFAKVMKTAKASRHYAEVSQTTWRQYWSDWRTAARHYGLLQGQARNTAPRSPAWEARLQRVPSAYQRDLVRFAGEMSRRGVEPDEVRPEHFDVFRQALDDAAVRNPARSFKSMAVAWHHAQAAQIGWPETPAPMPAPRRSFWQPWSAFPPSLEADVDAHFAARTAPKVFNIKTLFQKPTGKVIRAETAAGQKRNLRALASAAVAAGVSRERLVSLQSLLEREILEPSIEYLVERRLARLRDHGASRSDDKLVRGHYLYNIAHQAMTLKRHFGCPESELADLKGCIEVLAPKHQGMAQSTSDQVDVLRQPKVFSDLFALPKRLFDELDNVEDRSAEHGWTAALGLGLAITLDTAYRRSNVTSLRFDRHFGPIDRATGRMTVEIPAEDAKTDAVYMAELRARTVKLVERYVTTWRSLIYFSGDTQSLFPDETGGSVDPRRFASRLTRLVRRRLGVDFTMHRVRSLLASLYAEANPDDQRTAQLKLGHADRRTTEKFYISSQQRQAIRRFDEVIDSILATQAPPDRQPRRGR